MNHILKEAEHYLRYEKKPLLTNREIRTAPCQTNNLTNIKVIIIMVWLLLLLLTYCNLNWPKWSSPCNWLRCLHHWKWCNISISDLYFRCKWVPDIKYWRHTDVLCCGMSYSSKAFLKRIFDYYACNFYVLIFI